MFWGDTSHQEYLQNYMCFTNRTRCPPSPSRNSSRAVSGTFLAPKKLSFWPLWVSQNRQKRLPEINVVFCFMFDRFSASVCPRLGLQNVPWCLFRAPWSPCGRPGVPCGCPGGAQGGTKELQGLIFDDFGYHVWSFWGPCWFIFGVFLVTKMERCAQKVKFKTKIWRCWQKVKFETKIRRCSQKVNFKGPRRILASFWCLQYPKNDPQWPRSDPNTRKCAQIHP